MTDFGIWSLLPPVLAIVFAMATRKVFQALLLGIFTAGIMVAGASTVAAGTHALLVPFAAIAGGFMLMVQWLVEGIAGIDARGDFYIGHPSVIAFTIFLGALVALMQRAGGVLGFGQFFLRLGAGRRGGMVFTAVGGLFLAIDDYFHVIAAGSIFRPVTDRLRVSREKLSYLIDSTAAPAVILVPISTWAGYIIGEISSARRVGGFEDATGGSFGIFLAGIPFNFYAILTIAFVIFLAATGADWGPMAKAERRALRGDGLLRDGAKPLVSSELDGIEPIIAPRAMNLVVPVLFMIGSTILILAVMGGFPGTGFGTAIQDNPTPELSLAISSFLTVLFAMVFYAFQGMRQDDFVARFLDGTKAMVPALAILALAWGIGIAVSSVGLGEWIASGIGDSLPPEAIPLIAFVLGSVIAFATGTSFGTFAILIPITLPIAYATGGTEWLAPALAASIGGAVFGDHCSPISDTTVMSSMASQADHIDHVRTQLPYAVAVALVAIGGYGVLAITGQLAVAWIANLVLVAVLAAGTWLVWRAANRRGATA